jgi:hypothetical protein
LAISGRREDGEFNGGNFKSTRRKFFRDLLHNNVNILNTIELYTYNVKTMSFV